MEKDIKENECEDIEDKIKFHKNIIGTLQRTKGPFHKQTIDAEHKLARILAEGEKGDLALPIYVKVLKYAISTYGELDEKTADIKYEMAIINRSQSRYDEALEYFNDVLKVRKHYSGEKSLQVIPVKSLIASIYREKERYGEALEIYDDIYDVICSEFGEADHRALMARFWKARIMMKQGDDKGALEHLEYILPRFRDGYEEEAKIVKFFIKRIRRRQNCQCSLM